ncbi:MAG: tetratricopeptide repeat protein [Deltaproteobacteria bacterium]|nr:tetratricopeptide repeat protein [Deltaproteobacteria bacterium]
MLHDPRVIRPSVRPVVCLALALAGSGAARAANLAGTWEIQSMGADREVKVEQQGTKIIAHRIMWPEFEGQKYKLEHLYRGQLSGAKLQGDLLVKEEEVPSFEVLRAFTGSVTSDDRITLDGLPMKRVGAALPGAATPAPTVAPEATRPSEAPGSAKAPPPPPPPPPSAPPPTGPAKPDSGSAADPGTGLFASIMSSPGMQGLFALALRADIPEEAKSLVDEADRLYGNGAFERALAKYVRAQQVAGGQHAEFLHRMGRCDLKLARFDEAHELLRRALRLDPANPEVRKDYTQAEQRVARGKGKGKGRGKGR